MYLKYAIFFTFLNVLKTSESLDIKELQAVFTSKKSFTTLESLSVSAFQA